MRSSWLVCASVLLAACNKDSDDSSAADDSSGVDDSSGSDDSSAGVDADNDGYDSAADCDDADASVNPGATEVCDGIDNNCAGGVDEGVTSTFYADLDGDDHGAGAPVERCTAPKGYVESADDCDDASAASYPGATEVCDGLDNDCADGIDEGVTSPFFPDGDGDGYGAGTAVEACAAPTGHVDNGDDCDDLDGAAYPGAPEICDTVDNDCDSSIDDDDPDLTEATTYWQDGDADGYGNPSVSVAACSMPSGYVDNGDDCDDTNTYYTFYADKYQDLDLDGYGWGSFGYTCYSNYDVVLVGGDCDDYNAAVYPTAVEVCDDEDNDCNGYVDADDPAIVFTTWYVDVDEDGYGDSGTATDTCDPKPGYVTPSGDCDDGAYLVSPARDEYCDGVDNDCDGSVDEIETYVDWYRDDDGDHYGQDKDVVNDCAQPRGYDLNPGDCDDGDASVHPDQADVCGDGIDNECDTFVDNCLSDLDEAEFSLSGNVGSNYVGYSVASGDVDGDGTDDLLVGSPLGASFTGAVYVVKGATSGHLTVADVDATIAGSSSEYFGSSVTAADVDGDGTDDVLTGAAWTSKAFLFLGPISSTTVASADVSFTDAVGGNSFGNAVALADLDGDPDLDMAIGAPYDSSGYGTVSIFLGPLSGAVSSADADLAVTGTVTYGYAGEVANLGDLDGDGLDDLAQSAYYGGSSYQGEVYVLDPGSTTGTVSPSTIAKATLTGDASYDQFGYRFAGGDYNGDGYGDLFVTALSVDDGFAYDAGRVFGWLGPVSGAFAGSSADVMISGDTTYGTLGSDVELGDVSGDGADDVVIGRQNADSYVGTAYLVQGPATGSIGVVSAVTLGKPNDGSVYNYVGYAVGMLGDWSGDDADEVVVTGWGMPYGTSTYAGRTWVVSSDGL
jgi:hypothetical protein